MQTIGKIAMKTSWCCVVVGGLAARSARSAEAADGVSIMADDLGWGSVDCYGATPAIVQTQHIDRRARDGRGSGRFAEVVHRSCRGHVMDGILA